ncbi:hypothetical protein [Thermostaphylospora chromogena]|uniref:Uncharacterized protein n=1 Tax=Thermostaphylospora chromogena TaxID=35622 RepID=A0A1H1DQ50_9ACTN|nr:hypothetical protein [Thermostaphylospora chromogena]SDQ77986.1 hypothetical protein SAMN04489764_2088 [Thermostaphylospora chromogena]
MTGRQAMARQLSLDAQSPTKTFVLEAHTEEPADYLRSLFGESCIEETEDAFLYIAHMPEGDFWVDQPNQRFWSFHTDMPAAVAGKYLHERVESNRDLDWIWLPSEHLRHIWPGAAARQVRTTFEGERMLGNTTPADSLRVRLSGRGAEALLDFISQNSDYRAAVSFESISVDLSDPDFGTIHEAVNYKGRFAASGNSFDYHLQFVATVVDRYSRLVRRCEEYRISTTDLTGDDSGGYTLSGSPITLLFSRPIPDMNRFLGELFSSRHPFRLWGIPEVKRDIAYVDAVDLHVGDALRFDIGPEWMRIYLPKDACGNVITRLVTNLQHRFDSALKFADPDLQAAFSLREFSVA